jgi:folate-dependent phosphoribosylglycinamide formyltransferase PurN
MSKQYALILNDEEFFYADVLEGILAINPHFLKKVYIVDPFTPDQKKFEYLIKSLPIIGLKFLIKYILILRQKKREGRDLRSLCQKHNIPWQKIGNVNHATLSDDLKQNAIDIVLSLSSQIYRKKVIEQLPILNFHPSLLPKHKGRFPIFWALYENDQVLGMTCHRVREKIDAGEIIYQEQLPITVKDNFSSLTDKILAIAPNFILNSVNQIDNNIPFLAPKHKSSYGPMPSWKQLFIFQIKMIKRYFS